MLKVNTTITTNTTTSSSNSSSSSSSSSKVVVPTHVMQIYMWSTAAAALGTSGSKWSTSRSDRFAPEKETPEPFEPEAVWAPEPVWTIFNNRKKPSYSSHDPNPVYCSL